MVKDRVKIDGKSYGCLNRFTHKGPAEREAKMQRDYGRLTRVIYRKSDEYPWGLYVWDRSRGE